MLTHADLTEGGVEVQGCVGRHAIIAYITLVHQILHMLWVPNLLHM